MAPRRIQLSRRKGWRKPENTIVVARPTRWGNPFPIAELGRERAIASFRAMLADPAAREAVGYPAPDPSNVYLKDLTDSWLSSCTPNCTTTQYKSLTRKHIESLGYDLVGNFGDQYSDLRGGYADRTFKLPNPMYYLP